MNGTKLPETIRELSKEKEITLFVDGDRGGKLIIRNVLDNADVKYIVVAPDGKEVEELTGKEILMNLRKKQTVSEFFSREKFSERTSRPKEEKESLSEKDKEKLRELSKENQGTGKAIILDGKLEEIKKVSARSLNSGLKRIDRKPFAIVIDGIVTGSTIRAAEESNIQVIAAKNFATTDTRIQLLSL